jgi:hypothetical protein
VCISALIMAGNSFAVCTGTRSASVGAVGSSLRNGYGRTSPLVLVLVDGYSRGNAWSAVWYDMSETFVRPIHKFAPH